MKTNVKNVNITMSYEELERMTREVKETLALDHCKPNKTFGSVDLWNIHRKKKSIALRRVF